MVDNQHKQIKGYRDLSQEEIDLMNMIKTKAEECGELIAALRCGLQNGPLDQRWVSIAETHLQQGFMAATRAVAQPTTF